jgi:FtsZ-binding cell division protein ZapB
MDTLEKLEEKINKAVALIEKLTNDNEILINKNNQINNELSELKLKLAAMDKTEIEKSEKVRDKLNSIIGKLNIIEQI